VFQERLCRCMSLGLHSIAPTGINGSILDYPGLPVGDIEKALDVLRQCLDVEYGPRRH